MENNYCVKCKLCQSAVRDTYYCLECDALFCFFCIEMHIDKCEISCKGDESKMVRREK